MLPGIAKPKWLMSYREHHLPVSENLLQQDFSAGGSNQKWAGDIDLSHVSDGFIFLDHRIIRKRSRYCDMRMISTLPNGLQQRLFCVI
ncbi:hypothetical protein D5071_00645 [Pectobacterium carotovorum]|uniref:Transposase n=1 Tax=Pectobacterium carotovorum TaxID=554 RepID=A0A419B1Z1_PECCA|nr:hypothetical protein D5071_00645 [Pectobacterium carotovorum]